MFLTPTQVNSVTTQIATYQGGTAAAAGAALKAWCGALGTVNSGILSAILMAGLQDSGVMEVVGANAGVARTDIGTGLKTWCDKIEACIVATTTLGS